MGIRVYSQHKGSNIIMPESWMNTLNTVQEFAHSTAQSGIDGFYRVFELTDESPTGERFITAHSVLDGKVREHNDVTIPTAHW